MYTAQQMEEGQNTQQNSQSGVSFPTVGQGPKKNNGAKTLLIAGILILVGILGFVIFKSATKKSEVISIDSSTEDNLTTPTENETLPSPSPVPSASPVATTKAVAKSGVSIEVQNGTGITGEAAYLQNQLKDLGYTKVNVGNASSQDATVTTVTFSKTLSSEIVDEITKKLQSLYQEVSVKTSSTQLGDVLIVTGPRKGTSVKSTPTASPKSTPTASPKATSTP